MKIISSQHYLCESKVEEKIKMLQRENATQVIVPCSYVGEIDGVEYAIIVDCHHTMAAARALGIGIEFDISNDSEGLTGEELLDARYIDGDYYFVKTSNPSEEKFDLVW